MTSSISGYKLNKNLLELLNIEDKIYNNKTLRTTLGLKMKSLYFTMNIKNSNNYILTPELQSFLNEDKKYIDTDILVTLISISYSDNINYPNCQYYHYNQKPNYC